MDFRVSMMKRRLAAWLLLCFLACLVAVPAQAEQLLLITAGDWPAGPLSGDEIKRLFLAAPVSRDGRKLVPVINRSDGLTYQIFLQSVMGRSAYTYEKQLLGRLYTSGIQPPEVIRERARLYDVLRSRPGAISFILARDLDAQAGLRTLQVLWKGEIR